MRVDDQRRLECPVGSLGDPVSYLLKQASGRTVLNVGAGGGVVDHYLPAHRDQWMHHRLSTVASSLTGLDLDERACAVAAQHGYEIVHGDCETAQLDQRFEMILMSDVIEHVNSPTQAVLNLTQHLRADGILYVTTPNATFVGDVIDAVLRRPVDVYHDHVAIFLPEHLQTICDRHGLVMRAVKFFSFIDQRTPKTRLRSQAVRAFGLISPRLHGHFLAEIQLGEAL